MVSQKPRFHPPLPSSVPSQTLTPKSPRSSLMAAADADAAEVERLYELGERLSSAKDKSEVPPRSPIFCYGRSAFMLGFWVTWGFLFRNCSTRRTTRRLLQQWRDRVSSRSSSQRSSSPGSSGASLHSLRAPCRPCSTSSIWRSSRYMFASL